MSTLGRFTDTVRDTLDVLAEGWQEIWNRARTAITRFTPSSEDEGKDVRVNRWGLLSAELHESEDSISVALEAPGLSKDDFEIFVSDSTLIIRGRKSASSTRKEGHYHITERAYGHFERAFSLPCGVEQAGVTANYKQGVLSINLPKSAAEKPRIIAIN